jgi:hypothetical protein
VAIKVCTPDLLELVNNIPAPSGDEIPTLLLEVGIWNTETGNQTGVAFEVFGSRAPLASAAEVRRIAKWLMQAAEAMDGSRDNHRRGQKKRRHDEDDE